MSDSDIVERLRKAAAFSKAGFQHDEPHVLHSGAADEIATLEQQLAECRAENERLRGGWIPVEERLPPDTPDCVIVYDGVSVCLADGDYVVYEIRYKDYLRTYTHWRPLPDPPEVSDEHL